MENKKVKAKSTSDFAFLHASRTKATEIAKNIQKEHIKAPAGDTRVWSLISRTACLIPVTAILQMLLILAVLEVARL